MLCFETDCQIQDLEKMFVWNRRQSLSIWQHVWINLQTFCWNLFAEIQNIYGYRGAGPSLSWCYHGLYLDTFQWYDSRYVNKWVHSAVIVWNQLALAIVVQQLGLKQSPMVWNFVIDLIEHQSCHSADGTLMNRWTLVLDDMIPQALNLGRPFFAS